MSRPRYVVSTVSGYTFNMPIASAVSGSAREGLSAHVCDTVYLHEVVATYRSTDGVKGRGAGTRIGADGALAAAKAHAERLNRDTA